ncbi:MAG: hypothetical protein HYT67_00410 [Candidatus Yanofskybacteria bacterium]|nr:hypothetical protein [Candidatus Yanofskybacteria bacterium]
MNKKLIAKEWLVFLKWLLIGVVVMPLFLGILVLFIDGDVMFGYIMKALYSDMFGGDVEWGPVGTWLWILIPYGIFNLVRSIKWARRNQ